MCAKMHTPLSDQIRDLVTSAMAAENVGARRFEDRLGLKRWTLRGFLDPERKQSPSIDRAQEICRAMGLDLYVAPRRDLDPQPRGELEASKDREASPAGVEDSPLGSEQSVSASAIEGEKSPSAADGFVRVPLHDVQLSAGAGARNDTEEAGDHLLFRQDWMRKIGLAPRYARLARARGDSMAPILSDRDLVLLDTSKTEIPIRPRGREVRRRSRLVAFEQDGEARIKWAERPDSSTLVLFSENTALYSPEIYVREEAAQIRVIGHVVWWGHTVRRSG